MALLYSVAASAGGLNSPHQSISLTNGYAERFTVAESVNAICGGYLRQTDDALAFAKNTHAAQDSFLLAIPLPVLPLRLSLKNRPHSLLVICETQFP